MNKHKDIFHRIAVVSHPSLAEAIETAPKVLSFLEGLCEVTSYASLDEDTLLKSMKNNEHDLLIALGGDGTVLRAGRLCAPYNIPILPINFGRFGFLIEVNADSWEETLTGLFSGDFWFEERMMLNTEHWRDDESLGTWEVLNEAMVGRGDVARPVHLITSLDGRPLTTYVADGLIVATATGSTAYALAAGGPILPPELRNILIMPVAPHLSVDRAIVLAEGSTVTVEVGDNQRAVLNLDGQLPVELTTGDRITVRASKYSVRFVRFQDPGYFYRHLIKLMDQNPSARAN
ncbi:MAG: NAD(+)/NADH kinase [Chloroflexi bacterium]|nr:NAD(+)/NADH kinase [Chloroflexota bacterium]